MEGLGGLWDQIPVYAWVGGTQQPIRMAEINSQGNLQADWIFWLEDGPVTVRIEPGDVQGEAEGDWVWVFLGVECSGKEVPVDEPEFELQPCKDCAVRFRLVHVPGTATPEPEGADAGPSHAETSPGGGNLAPLVGLLGLILSALAGLIGWRRMAG